MSGPKKNDRRGKTSEAAADIDPEVAELLRAADDDMVLKLGAGVEENSFLDADLARRFQALKSPPPISVATAKPSTSSRRGESPPVSVDEEWQRVLGDDLAARFAKLKGSEGDNKLEKPVMAIEEDEDSDEDSDGDGVRKKEVERVMQWAADAARLDALKGEDGDGDSEDEEEDDEEEMKEKKGKSSK